MCSKMFVEIIKDNLFEKFTTKREERYWSVVSNGTPPIPTCTPVGLLVVIDLGTTMEII